IEKARLFEQTTRRARRNTRLAELSRLVTETLDAERVQRFVTQAAADLLDADLTRLFLVDADGATLSRVALVGADTGIVVEREAASRSRLSLHGSTVGWAVQARKRYFARDLQTHARAQSRAWAVEEGYRSQLVAPLLVGNQALGALDVVF